MSNEDVRTPMSLAEAEGIARQLDHWGIDVGPGSTLAERRDAVPVVLLRELDRLRAVEAAARELVAQVEPIDQFDPDSVLVVPASVVRAVVAVVRPDGAA